MNLKHLIRLGANAFGVDIVRLPRAAGNTLLGLAGMNFGSIIDVGANEGQFARRISAFFPKAEIYSFEPLEEPYQKLTAWADTQAGRVRCFNLALGDWEGEAEMHLHSQFTPSSSLLAATENCHRLYPQTQVECLAPIRVSTLDRTLTDALHRMRRDILLKLDVQGFEDRVLRGAGRVLSECRAVISEVCLDPLYEGQAEFSGLARILYRSGFRYAGNLDQAYGQDGRVVFLDAVFLRQGT